tara:strand:- start:249 stop:374 length:126 start_codon:yes stop_codon:yes gene_type:complete
VVQAVALVMAPLRVVLVQQVRATMVVIPQATLLLAAAVKVQ